MTMIPDVPQENPRNKMAFAEDLVGKKLKVKIWSNNGEHETPRVLHTAKTKYGQPHVTWRAKGGKRMYQIDYEHKGAIKQDGKSLIYDTVFDNAVGALTFYEHDEDIDSGQAYTMFLNSAVNMYVKKGGIPLIYLIVAMIGMVVAIGITGWLGIAYKQLSDQHILDFHDLLNAEARIHNDEQALTKNGIPIPAVKDVQTG